MTTLKTSLNLFSRHPYATLTVAAILLRVLVALVITEPGFVDAYYYYQVAQNWHDGRGLTESTVWNYQAGSSFDPTATNGLEHTAFTYWTPLSSLLIIASFSLFGVSYIAAALPFMLCAVALAPLAYWLGILIFGPQQRRYSWTMGLITLFPGRFFFFWNSTDNFAPFALIILLGLISLYLGLYRNDRWLLLAGLMAGLAYLSRSDGSLFGVTVVLSFGWRKWELAKTSSTEKGPRWVMLLATLVLAGLVVAPWLVRNQLALGSFLPANNSKVLFLRQYEEFFSYQLNLNASYYFGWGWANILGQKVQTLGINALLMIFEGLLLVGPLLLFGLWVSRKRLALQPFWVYVAVLYLVMSLGFSEIGSHGTIFHSSGALVPYQAGLALAGLEWLGRGKPRPRAASIMALVAIGVTLYFAAAAELPGWDSDYRTANQIEPWLAANAGPKDVIMIGEPLSFHYATGRPAIALASDGLEANLAAAKQYRANWVILGRQRYKGLDNLYQQKTASGAGVELRLTTELANGIQIYKVIKQSS